VRTSASWFWARELQSHSQVAIEVRYEGGSDEQFGRWLGSDLLLSPQGAGDLGSRMERAFREAFRTRVGPVVLVGTDCPGMTSAHLREAFVSLRHKDLVLGPAKDGGYYLIGLRRDVPGLFRGVSWGSGEVLERTLHIARARNLHVELLDLLDDVDRPEDLPVWEHEKDTRGVASSSPRISIIIPVRDEAETIVQALASTEDAEYVVERLVVDGGSHDGTVQKARACGAQVLVSPCGRARQMNAGARAATGDTFLFLHADTCLPHGFEHHVRQILGRPGTVAGAFRLRFDGKSPALRLIELLANVRSTSRAMPYGDQAIFLQADRFNRAGGFPEMPLMEDFELMRRLRRQGRIEIAPVAAVTSARRYEQKGALRTAMLNKMIILAYVMGVSPDRLAHWYRSDPQSRESVSST
jgi:rSAM/selenodomain-associated transferase 2/rSAM/selenodomain-associated transferase 1